MKYMIILNESAADFENRDGAGAAAYWGAHKAYCAALTAAGVFVDGNALQPPETGTTLRLRDSQRHVHDGPFADTKEQLGGYTIIDVPNLDVALEWAARCPAAATGTVEVRPLLQLPG